MEKDNKMTQQVKTHLEYVNCNNKDVWLKETAKEILEQLKIPKNSILNQYEKEFGSDYIAVLTKVKLLFADMVFEMLEQEVRLGVQPKVAYKKMLEHFTQQYKFSDFWTEAKNILKAYKM
jgi:hypothetical protein